MDKVDKTEENIVFNNQEMQKFICEFNPTKVKYDITSSSLYYVEALAYDNQNKSVNLKKNRIQDMIYNTNLIYSSPQQSINYGTLYNNVLNKFLLDFVNIPNIGSLYDSQYMDFEWNMHSNLNFEKHTNSYYRDHFIHQVRNMFMALRLIEDQKIYKNMVQALTSTTRGKVSQYFNKKYDLWINSLDNNANQKILLQNIASQKNGVTDDEKNFYKKFFCNYVIRASLIISCLFHDIGYPVAYYLSVKDRLVDFIPSVYSIMGDNNFDFNYIYSLLSESVLFQFVGKDDICDRFIKNDHGTISAILVGIFFYKTGMIHSLSSEKQAAVELGMLAIYNHTLELKICDLKKNTRYVKMQFALNPISYILRWCDDMQEWDREYFEIAPISSLLYCSKCRFPLRRERILPSEYFSKNGVNLDENLLMQMNMNPEQYGEFFSYKCLCCKKDEYKFIKRDNFTRRKLLQIKACDSVVIERNDSTNDNSNILIDFKYNSYKLLRLSNINPQFIEKRQEGINSLKAFLFGQRFVMGNRGYRYILIKHNLYANPLILKALIIKDFLKSLRNRNHSNIFSDCDTLDTIKQSYTMIRQRITNNITDYFEYEKDILELANNIVSLCYSKTATEIENGNTILSNCQNYVSLAIYREIFTEHNGDNFESIYQSIKESFTKCQYNSTINYLINNAFQVIEDTPDLKTPQETIQDSLIQIINNRSNNQSDIDDMYFRYPSDDKYLFSVIAYYCNPQSDMNDINQNAKLTYYTDLYLYEQLSYLTELMEYNFNRPAEESAKTGDNKSSTDPVSIG